MAAQPPPPPGAETTDNTMLHVVYGLYALTFLIGIAGIAAIVIAYLQRGKTLSDMQRSHVEWQIWTFWWSLLLGAAAFLMMFVLSGFGGFILYALLAIWFVYRVAKGWLWLKDGRMIEDPKGLM